MEEERPRESTRVAEHQPPGAGEQVELFKTLIKSCEELKDRLFSTTFLAGNPPFPGRSDNSQPSGSAGLTTITCSDNYLERHPEAVVNAGEKSRYLSRRTIGPPGPPEQETAPAVRQGPVGEQASLHDWDGQAPITRSLDHRRSGNSREPQPNRHSRLIAENDTRTTAVR